MLKRLLALALLFCFFSVASAEILLVYPIDKKIFNGDSLELGSVAPGETIELVFSNDSKRGFEWGKAVVAKDTLPKDWKAEDSALLTETLSVKISVPKNSVEKVQNIKIVLASLKDEKKSEDFTAVFFVRNSLIRARMDSLSSETVVGKPAAYRIILINDSIAPHKVKISSTLPKYWFSDRWIAIKGKATEKAIVSEELSVNPKVYGDKEFTFFVDSELNGRRIDAFNTRLRVQPTLEGKFAAGFFGYSFFSPMLLPFYLINSFLSLAF